MKIRDWLIHARATLDEVKAAAKSAFQSDDRAAQHSDLIQLEDRVLMSATPVAVVAEPEADSSQEDAIVTESDSSSGDANANPTIDPGDEPRIVEDSAELLDEAAGELAVDAVTTVREVVFIDELAENYEQLISDLTADREDNRSFEVFVLDSSRDGVDQVSNILSSLDDIDAVHVVSHGTDRAVKLGSTWLTLDNFDAYAGDVAGWGDALAEGADLLFYGCELAGSEDGRALLESVQTLTGADLAASTDDTGAAVLGGDWEMEFRIGDVESQIAFTEAVQNDWRGLLNTFVVTNTNASGAGTLQQAIIDANSLNGFDTITFNIGGGGPHAISLDSVLPVITDAVLIDGWSDPDWVDAPMIVVDGTNAGASADGLRLGAGSSGSTIRGLVITNFDGDGIQIDADSSRNTIVGNWIGLSADGISVAGNASDGLEILGANNVIGGTTATLRNVISGNDSDGIAIVGAAATGNVVQGNYIGTDATGTLDRGNGDDGIDIDGGAADNLIGGVDWGAGNLIAYNSGRGIEIDSAAGAGNSLLANSIYANADIGIDLAADSVTANDLGDADTGANNLQNFPVLTSAFTDGASTVAVTGHLNSTAYTSYRIEYFVNSGAGDEGETYLGHRNVIVGADGNASVLATFAVDVAVGANITATATNLATGDTSEFSSVVSTSDAPGG